MTANDPKRTLPRDPAARCYLQAASARTSCRIVAVVLSLFASGCAQTLSKDEALESSDESIIVLGVGQHDVMAFFRPGSVRLSGTFKETAGPGAVSVRSVNGFVVAKIPSGRPWGLVQMFFKQDGATHYTGYWPCAGCLALTLDLPAGKVIYVGHLQFEVQGKELVVKRSWDPDSARSYIDQNYPRLRGRTETSLYYQLRKFADNCYPGSAFINCDPISIQYKLRFE